MRENGPYMVFIIMEITHTILELQKRGIHKERFTVPHPKTKEEAQILFDLYNQMRAFYGSEMKRINKDVLPKLRELLK